MPVVTRSQTRPQALQLHIFAANHDLDFHRFRQWIESEEIKGTLTLWWRCEPIKEPHDRSRTREYFRLVKQKATSVMDSHCNGSESVTFGERYTAFNPRDDVDVSSQTIEHLIFDANGNWNFCEKTSVKRAISISISLLKTICVDMEQNGSNSYFTALFSSRYRDWIDSESDGDEENSEENSSEDDELDDSSDDVEDSLNDFVVKDGCEREMDIINVSKKCTEDKFGPNLHSRSFGEKAQEAVGEPVIGKPISKPSVRPVAPKDYGIFASSWAQRVARKGLCKTQSQHKRKLSAEPKNHQRRRKIITEIISDDEQDDEKDFGDVKRISNLHREDSSDHKECENNPGPSDNVPMLQHLSKQGTHPLLPPKSDNSQRRTASWSTPPSSVDDHPLVQYWRSKAAAAQEGEAAALFQLQSIKTRTEGVEEAMRAAEVMKTDLQKELEEAMAARKTAEEEAANARKEMAAVKAHDNIGRALREAGFAFVG
ncbi:MAG: hypothetical protein Q9157_008236 [Trypethelium eluteriae]